MVEIVQVSCRKIHLSKKSRLKSSPGFLLTCKRWGPSAHQESCSYHSLLTSRRSFGSLESSSLSFECFSQAQNAEERQRNFIRAIWQTPWQSTCILATIKMASWTMPTKNTKLCTLKSTVHQWNMSSENTSSNTISGDIYLDRFTKIIFYWNQN